MNDLLNRWRLTEKPEKIEHHRKHIKYDESEEGQYASYEFAPPRAANELRLIPSPRTSETTAKPTEKCKDSS